MGSHMRAFDWYRPRWPWMILNGVIALILRFLPNSIALQADYVKVVEDRPIISVKYCLPVSVFHFWPKLIHPAARSLCDCWDTCSVLPRSVHTLLRCCGNFTMNACSVVFLNKIIQKLYRLAKISQVHPDWLVFMTHCVDCHSLRKTWARRKNIRKKDCCRSLEESFKGERMTATLRTTIDWRHDMLRDVCHVMSRYVAWQDFSLRKT